MFWVTDEVPDSKTGIIVMHAVPQESILQPLHNLLNYLFPITHLISSHYIYW
jgi:hypothetical protein